MKIPLIGSSPVKKNISANLLGVIIHLINQVILVPFYIIYWGKDLYSDWIVLSSLTAFFAMSDIGINNVIQNRFAIKYAEEDYSECKSLITDNILLVTGVFTIILIVCYAIVSLCNLKELMHIRILSTTQTDTIFILLLCRVFIDMYRGIENAIYRAVHKAHRAILLDQSTNMAIAIITLLCLICKVSIVTMCYLTLIPSCCMIIFKYINSKSIFEYSFNLKYIDFTLFRQITLPALSFLSFPIGNTIILQGYTLLINAFFGPATVVLYNTTRTLCNFSKTILNTLQNSVWPEYSIAYGKKDYHNMRRLHRKTLMSTIIASFFIGISLLVCGPTIYRIWLHNTISFNFNLMLVYCIVIFAESIWMSSSVTLMATNNHLKIGVLYILFTSIALGLAILLGELKYSITVITSTLILSNIAMCFFAIRSSLKLTHDHISLKSYE